MKKFIISFLLLLTICFSVEIRTFLEQELAYDKNYYSDLGLDVRFKANKAMFQIKRGIVFSSLKRPLSMGNHEWYYIGFNTRYYSPIGTFYAEILTEQNPFEGNDFGLTKQSSTQSLGYGIGPFNIKREKITNGDFYSEASYEIKLGKDWFRSYLILSAIGKGNRANGNVINIFDDKLYALQVTMGNWLMIPIYDSLDFTIRGTLFARNYVEDLSTDLGYSFSVGLIAY